MATAATLTVEINGKDTGVTKLLDDIERRLRALDKAGGGAGGAGPLDPVSRGADRARGSFLALQQAQASLERTQGNLAQAAERLRTVLAGQTSETTQTIAARRQLASVEQAMAAQARQTESAMLQEAQSLARLQRASGDTAAAIRTLQAAQSQVASGSVAFNNLGTQIAQLEKGKTSFQEFGESAKSGLLGIVGPAAVASAAIGGVISIVKSFSDAFEFKANLDATTRSIELQLKGVRDSATTFAQARAFADRYKLTQEELNGALQASVGVFRQSKASADEILGTLLRLQQLSPEQGLEGAALALKELAGGSTQSLVGRFEVSATAAAKMREEIRGGADAVQVLSDYLENAGIGMDSLAARTEGAKGKMLELKQAQEDLTLAQAEFAQGPGLTILNERITVTRGLTRLLSGDWQTMAASQQQAISGGISGMSQWNPLAEKLAQIISQLTGYQLQNADATEVSTQAILRAADADDRHTLGVAGVSAAVQQVTNDILGYNAQLDENAQKAVLAAAQQDTQRVATDALSESTRQAAVAFLNLNPGIDAAGIAALVTAGKIPPLVGQLAALAIQARDARNALAELAAQQAGISAAQGALAKNPLFDPSASVKKVTGILGAGVGSAANKVFEENNRIHQSEVQLALARAKTDAQRIAILQKELGLTTDIAKKNQLLAQIEGLRGSGGKGKGRGGAGAGKVKLTDQQKLENSLLTDQDKYEQDSEDQAAKHAVKLIEIQLQFNEKMQKAQQQFQQDQLDSRASFYDNLGKIENAGLRKSFSEQYEAAFAEAEQIAKEKGADVADAYLREKQRVIEARAQRAAEIEQARKDKDKDKEEYLKGVDKLYQQSEDARLARIKEGNDSIASERDKAIADENNDYINQQNQLADKVNDSADRRIAAAQREGKAIDETRLKVDGLADSYDKVNRAAGVPAAGSANVPTTPSGTANAPTATVAPAEGGSAVLDALNAIKAAVDAARDAIVRAEGDVARAVRKQVSTGGIAG